MRIIRLSVISLTVFFVLAGGMLIWAATLDIPDLNTFEERDVIQSTKIFDRTGKVVLYDVHGNIKRTVIPFNEISEYVKKATIAIEDANFYKHKGIDFKGIARAVVVNLSSGGINQGGSTITQQVIKNALLTRDRKIKRKIKEIILAVKLEKVMTKDEILSLYLNEAPYGGSIYGIEEASQSFFGKSSKELNLAQAAYLAALPKAPTYYSPYGQHRDKLDERKNIVLAHMENLGMISEDEKKKAEEEKVDFMQRDDGGIKAPHFVDFVRAYLEEKYGREAIEREGYRVITTLDWKLQEAAEKIVSKFAKENEAKFRAKNAGLAAVDPKSGHILVMVGSRDYFDRENEGNFNISTAYRQPGSAFKPFTYATAFLKGYTPETVLFDLKTEFDTSCSPDSIPLFGNSDCYHPDNYDNMFRGPVSIRNALAQSINIPSVKVMYLAGIDDSIKTAVNMGIKSLSNANQYGLSLALGGGEVSLLDMVSAYGVFANDGVYNPYAFILKIEDANGNILEEFKERPKRVLDENVARMISSILADNAARAPAFGESSYLNIEGREVAVKTGTTNDYRDAWIIGYTPNVAVGSWAGNNNNTPMEKKVAGFIVAPMWNAFIREVLVTMPDERFIKPRPTPTNIKPILKGIWQGEEISADESGKEKVVINVHSILYWLNKDNPRGSKPNSPDNDPQFRLWEKPVRDWAAKNGYVDKDTQLLNISRQNIATQTDAPIITIKSPFTNETYGLKEIVPVNVSIKSKFSIERIDFYLNDIFIGSSVRQSFSFIPENVEGLIETNRLSVVAYDKFNNKGQADVILNMDF